MATAVILQFTDSNLDDFFYALDVFTRHWQPPLCWPTSLRLDKRYTSWKSSSDDTCPQLEHKEGSSDSAELFVASISDAPPMLTAVAS